jgi:hypothetical protein
MSKKLWFRRKTYGWGWTPITWQGWLLLLVYLTLFTFTLITFDHEWLKNLIVILLLTITLIGICYKTGESPKWQWGHKSNRHA